MSDKYAVHHRSYFIDRIEDEEIVEFQLHLSPEFEMLAEASEQMNQSPHERNYLSHSEHSKLFKLSKDTENSIKEFADTHGLTVDKIDANQRVAHLKGTSQQIQSAFGVQMGHFHDPDPENTEQKALGYQGELQVPGSLEGRIASIEGLDGKSAPKEKRVRNVRPGTPEAEAETAPETETDTKPGYWPTRVAEAYSFPDGDGSGECIGIVELGGTFKQSDIDGYFAAQGMTSPEIVIMGTKPNNDSLMNNVEVTSDIQVAGSLAPKAKIVIYYGASIMEALRVAVYDTKNAPSVISISWAGSEFEYSPAQLQTMQQLCREAALKGITVIAASGDHGAYNVGLAPSNIHFPNVNVPASIPTVLGCGGTNLQLSGDSIESEVVWNEELGGHQAATGGGFSSKFYRPSYQEGTSQHYFRTYPQFNNAARGVPDVGASAASTSGYTVLFDGRWTLVGGSSLSTPLWAALIIRLNQNLGYRLGYVNNELYKQAGSRSYHAITSGNNGHYYALAYWNACTGLGSPNGRNILDQFRAVERASAENVQENASAATKPTKAKVSTAKKPKLAPKKKATTAKASSKKTTAAKATTPKAAATKTTATKAGASKPTAKRATTRKTTAAKKTTPKKK